jgi:uncharacterized protein YqeY
MTLKEKISKNYMVAFKERNTVEKNLLSVVKGDIQTIEKNTGVNNLSDEDVIKILTKTAKSLKETILLTNDEKSKLELSILQEYLPKLMSKEEVTIKVNELVSSGITQIGLIMKEFSSLPVDKKIVSEVVNQVLKNKK